jgi:hypothetical protein
LPKANEDDNEDDDKNDEEENNEGDDDENENNDEDNDEGSNDEDEDEDIEADKSGKPKDNADYDTDSSLFAVKNSIRYDLIIQKPTYPTYWLRLLNSSLYLLALFEQLFKASQINNLAQNS